MSNMVELLRQPIQSLLDADTLRLDAALCIERQQGQIGVLCELLRECVKVIETIDTESADEFDDLCDLTDKVQSAIAGVGL